MRQHAQGLHGSATDGGCPRDEGSGHMPPSEIQKQSPIDNYFQIKIKFSPSLTGETNYF